MEFPKKSLTMGISFLVILVLVVYRTEDWFTSVILYHVFDIAPDHKNYFAIGLALVLGMTLMYYITLYIEPKLKALLIQNFFK